jgi:hypothetical protein
VHQIQIFGWAERWSGTIRKNREGICISAITINRNYRADTCPFLSDGSKLTSVDKISHVVDVFIAVFNPFSLFSDGIV